MPDQTNNNETGGSTKDTGSQSTARPRQQYHYLYGSTDTAYSSRPSRDHLRINGNSSVQPTSTLSSYQAAAPDHHHHHQGAASPTATDQESLVGESLVPTDNEHEDLTPNASEQDFQQLLITNDNGRVLHALHNPHRPTGGQLPPSALGNYIFHMSGFRKFRESYPYLYAATIVTTFSVLFAFFAVVLFPKSWLVSSISKTQGPTLQAAEFTLVIPFQHIDRSQSNDPVSHFLNKDLIDPALHAAASSSADGSSHEFIFPFPTGAFWVNLVLPPTADRGISYPIAVYPYAYKWSDSLLQLSYPALHRQTDAKAVHDYFFPDLTFSITETISQRYVTHFDPLSVTLRYNTVKKGNAMPFWETYLVQGSPYVTIKYDNVSPVIQAFSIFKQVICPRGDDNSFKPTSDSDRLRGRRLQGLRNRIQRRQLNSFGVCSSEQDGNELRLRGVQFAIESQEGMNWMVFASEPISLVFDTERKTTVISPERFKGVLRFAYIAPPSTAIGEDDSKSSTLSNVTSQIYNSPGLQRLIYHAGVYPVAADVSFSFRYAEPDYSMAMTAKELITGAVGATLRTDTQGAAVTSPIPALSTLSQASAENTSSTPTAESASPSSTSVASTANRVGTVTFTFSTTTFAPAASITAISAKPLLMLALPHHAKLMPSTSQLSYDQFDLEYQCIKGFMQPILGSVWSYDEPLPTLGLEVVESSSSRSTSESSKSSKLFRRGYFDPQIRSTIISSLKEDINQALPTLTENVYGFGKQSARLAQLAYISHVLMQTSNGSNNITTSEENDNKKSAPRTNMTTTYMSEEDQDLVDLHIRAVQILQFSISSFLTGNVSDALVFDDSLGGIITTDGLRNTEADFGNGRYNDHLFHYGYILYASAILGKFKPDFLHKYAQSVDALYYDVAHAGNFASHQANGVFFPGARHKVWFDGHSFASGLFPFGNGKSQESSSEAVNCYYGAYLWSLIRHDALDNPELDISAQTDFARLLLATEIRGAQKYWHMLPQNINLTAPMRSGTVYNAEFSKNYMVGNLGMMDAASSTWFGTNPLYVHMINEIPVTAVTEHLFGKNYVAQEYSHVLAPLGEVEMPWRGYVVCNHAMVDANAAWMEAQSLFSPTLDSGISKSQVLYFITTRPDFNVTLAINHNQTSTANATSTQLNNKTKNESLQFCSAHSKCTALGLLGSCCPTPDGTFLDCCDRK